MALAKQHILLETNIHVTYPAPAGAKCLTVTLPPHVRERPGEPGISTPCFKEV